MGEDFKEAERKEARMSTRTLWKRFALLFFPLAGLTTLSFISLYQAEFKTLRALTELSEKDSLQLLREEIRDEFDAIQATLLFLSRHQALKDLLAGRDSEQRLAQDYVVLLRSRERYGQIRLLDLQGKEWVRVNFNGGQPSIVPPEGLQNKKARGYFQKALQLQPGEIYLSPLNLKTERGIIEQPLKPTVQAITPIFDKQQRKQGILVLNYRGIHLLDKLHAAAQNTKKALWLVSGSGLWLWESGAGQNQGVIHLEKGKQAFAVAYPDLWAVIQNNDEGQFYAHKDLFTYTTITPTAKTFPPIAKLHSSIHWKLISQQSFSVLSTMISTSRIQRLILLYGIFLTVFIIVAGRLAYVHQRRERDARAVRLSEARFRGLFEAVPDGIVMTDSNGQILLVNAQAEKLFCYSREELTGQTIEILLPEQHRKAHVTNRQRYTQDAITRPMGVGLDLYGRRKDGTKFPAEISLSPLNKKEIDFSIISTIRDISERRRTEIKVRKLNQVLQQHVAELSTVNKELEAFSYSVSHDLRAPLRSIDGFSQALLEDYEDKLDSEGQDYLQRVRAATQRMGRLIDDLLQLSRITRAEMISEKVDLSCLAQEIATTLRTGEPQRQVEFCIEQGLTASGDSRLLRILLDNLLGNAWKFTAHQPQARIAMGTIKTEGQSAFFVRDNGAGFDMRYADKLFGAFQRLHGTNEYPGTGIGLATAQRIVHRHGGRIWAEGQINQGATFYFTL